MHRMRLYLYLINSFNAALHIIVIEYYTSSQFQKHSYIYLRKILTCTRVKNYDRKRNI